MGPLRISTSLIPENHEYFVRGVLMEWCGAARMWSEKANRLHEAPASDWSRPGQARRWTIRTRFIELVQSRRINVCRPGVKKACGDRSIILRQT
jgi:hypothetical protein